jgi:hypothetical protein
MSAEMFSASAVLVGATVGLVSALMGYDVLRPVLRLFNLFPAAGTNGSKKRGR